VTVIRLIEVLQGIIWIDLLNNFGLFTLSRIHEPIRTAGDFPLRASIGLVCAQAYCCYAADA